MPKESRLVFSRLRGGQTLKDTVQALSGAGAISVATDVTLFTSTGAGNALTLGAGLYTGQRKRICHIVKGSSGTGVITPASAGSFTNCTLTNVRAWVELVWQSDSKWYVCGYGDATFT